MNPEVTFWSVAIKKKIEYLDGFDRDQPVFFFIGGSSCAFSVDPEQLETDFNIQAINMGLHAGAGRALLTELALQYLQAGDILVVAFQDTFWREEVPFRPSSLGSQLYYRSKGMFQRPVGIRDLGIEPHWEIKDLRPDGYHLVTTFLKLAFGRSAYRYGVEDIGKGGLVTYSQGLIEADPSKGDLRSQMNEKSKSFLAELVEYCSDREIKVLVTLPWQYVGEDVLAKQREANQELIEQISEYCPVLVDPAMGARSEGKYFSDTLWHLTQEGVEIRTKRLGRAISQGLVHKK